MALTKLSVTKRKEFLHRIRRVKPHGPHRRDWLHWWVKTFEGVHIPNVKVCADHDAPFTAFADAFFGESSKGVSNTSVYLCHGSRLFGGKTFLAGTLARVRMILCGAEIFILGGSKDQTKQMRDYIKGQGRHMKNRGWNYKRSPNHLVKDILAESITLHNGASTTALAASEKATRSKHGTDLYCDEIDEMDYDVFTSALGQTYEGTDEDFEINPLTFLASTWQNPDGTMTQTFDLADENDWGVYTWCYRETHVRYGGHVTDAEIKRKRGEMTKSDWENEVELQRPASDDLIFDWETIEMTFDDTFYGYATKKGNFRDQLGKDYTFIEPNDGLYFYHGTDWAKERDFTIINTMCENPVGPDTVAAWCMRQKEPWPVMFAHQNKRIREYGGPSMFDGTGMAGDMIEDHLQVSSEPFDFSRRRELHESYSSLITGIEAGEYRLPNIPYLRKKFELLTRGQVYLSSKTSKKNHTPDPFVAMALARKAQLEGTQQLQMGRAW